MSKRKRKGTPETEETPAAPSPEEPGSPRRLLPVDIQQKEFRIAFRGYNEGDVDEFLDQVTEELARLHEETKRLSERVAEGGGGAAPGALIADAQRRAEEIVREAREQAAMILAGSESAASAAPGPVSLAGAAELRPFLSREREFLQGLASLIQGHAESVKRDAQLVRRSEEAPSDLGAGSGPGAAEPIAFPSAAAAPAAPAPATGDDAWGAEPEADAWATDDAPPSGGFGSFGAESGAAPLPPLPEAPVPAPDAAVPPAFAGAGDAPDWATDADDLSVPDATAAWTPPRLEPEPEDEPAMGSPQDPQPAVAGAFADPADQADQADPAATPGSTWSNPFSERSEPEAERFTTGAQAAPRPPAPSLLGPATAPPAPDERTERPPAPGGAPAAFRDEPDDLDREESDRSLRELFWGEE